MTWQKYHPSSQVDDQLHFYIVLFLIYVRFLTYISSHVYICTFYIWDYLWVIQEW